MVIEVISSNWKEDYLTKLGEYEDLGIPEYWTVDYAALGAIRYIGSPKLPTLSIYHLIDGEYQVSQFRGSDRLASPTFPDLVVYQDCFDGLKKPRNTLKMGFVDLSYPQIYPDGLLGLTAEQIFASGRS